MMNKPVERLAIDGGAPVRTTPFPSWPHYAPDEVEAVAQVLRSGRANYWTGEEGRRFEQEYATAIGAQHAVALMNGTVALESALHAFGIGPGDEVVVPCRTFIASASCIAQRGATPVVADIDPVSQNITADTIHAVLTPRTRAVITVHLAGWPCDMDPILELARQHRLKVIEDCAQAHGATYKGRFVGTFGHVAAFSFCQDKIISTGGEGGMLVTNDQELWSKVWSYKDHGKNYGAAVNSAPDLGFNWVHDSFGTNLRMTEMQAAIGRLQLKKLREWLDIRRRHAAFLNECFAGIPGLRTSVPGAGIGHAYYKYYVFVRPNMLKSGWTRDRILQAIVAEGIPCFTGSCPEIYLEKAFAERIKPKDRFRVARELGDTSLMFLVHPTLRREHMQQTCRVVEKVMREASV